MKLQQRAYALLTIKAVNEEQRIIRGMATTPAVDRVGDIVEPLGVQFKNPMPMLWQHIAMLPVGTVEFGTPTKDGVPFEAKLPVIDEPGTLKDRVDEAWQSVKLGLVRAVSIGFRPIEYSYIDGGGVRFVQIEVFELSLVTIPANADCVITEFRSMTTDALAVVKKFDAEALAASSHKGGGANLPGVTGSQKPVVVAGIPSKTPKEGKTMKTISEQIEGFRTARATKAARMEEIMNAAAEEGQTLDAEQTEEYDALSAEVKAIDAHLVRLKDMEAAKAASAKPVDNTVKTFEGGGQLRATEGVAVKAEPKLAKGIAFARLAKSVALGRLNNVSPVEIAKNLYGENNPVTLAVRLKAAVDAGTTISGNWAADLVDANGGIAADFAEYLRPMTILGKFGTGNIPSLRRVPFRRRLVGQTNGGNGYWVGEGKPKPLTAFDFSSTNLEPLKVASIAVCTKELLRDSSPSAEGLVRDSLAASCKERLDIDFINPAKAASAGVSPASITHGLVTVNSSGNYADAVRADIKAVFGKFIAANNAPTSGVWIMTSTVALGLSLMTNALGQPEFPGITMNGGVLYGLPVITSEYVPTVTAGSYVALVNAQDIYLSDDGDITIDMSTEASLEMKDSGLTQDATDGAGTSLVSLWQTNSVGFLAEQTINWAPRRDSAVALLDQVEWGEAA